jgi:hypothetical protein
MIFNYLKKFLFELKIKNIEHLNLEEVYKIIGII